MVLMRIAKRSMAVLPGVAPNLRVETLGKVWQSENTGTLIILTLKCL